MNELQTQTDSLLKALTELQHTADWIHLLLMIDVTLLFAIFLVIAFKKWRP
jgi:hypothetical protein